MTFWLKFVIVNALFPLFLFNLQLVVSFNSIVKLFAVLDNLSGDFTLEHELSLLSLLQGEIWNVFEMIEY